MGMASLLPRDYFTKRSIKGIFLLVAAMTVFQVMVSVGVCRFMQHRFPLIRGDAGNTQHWLLNDQHGENTLDIRNAFPFDSYSAVSFDSWDSPIGSAQRGAAMGYANPTHNGSVFDDAGYIETSDLHDYMRRDAPPAFRLVQTGNLTGMAGNHLRMEFTPRGDIYFYRPGVYPNQKPALLISSSGDVVVFGNLTVKGARR
jgi:hypothetical protein